jgi:hypothetical protein
MVHAREMHAYEIHACEMHAREVHACEKCHLVRSFFADDYATIFGHVRPYKGVDFLSSMLAFPLRESFVIAFFHCCA